MKELIFYFFYVLSFGTAFIFIADNICENKLTKGKLIHITVSVVVNLIIILVLKKDLLLLITNVVIIFNIVYRNSKILFYSVFMSIITILIIAIGDALMGLLITVALGHNINDISKTSLEYFLMGIGIGVISYGISLLLKNRINKAYMQIYELSKNIKVIVSIVLYGLVTFTQIYTNLYVYKYLAGDYNKIVVIVSAIAVISNFGIVYMILNFSGQNVRIKLEQEHKNNEYKQLIDYVSTVEIMSENLRKFKHDYLNIIESMRIYVESENMEQLKRFYKEELLPESKHIINEDISFNLLKNIKIDSIKALTASKIIKAKSLDIKVEIEILEKIEKLPVKEIDICRIIGILLDNAIEAAVLCEKKFIIFAIIKNEGYISIIIKNSCPKDTPPVYIIRGKGFSTKGKGRGNGLGTVDEITKEKYSDIDTLIEIENNIFLYEIQIKI